MLNRKTLSIISFVFLFFILFNISINSDLAIYVNFLFQDYSLFKTLQLNQTLKTSNLSINSVILVFLFFLFTNILGKICQNFLNIKGSFLSSFLFGFLFVVITYRVVSYFLPNYLAYPLVNIFLLSFTIKFIKLTDYTLNKKNFSFENIQKYFFFLVLFCFSSLILVDMGDFTFVDHGPKAYVTDIAKFEDLKNRYPVIHQNFEAVIYNYWLLYVQNLIFGKDEIIHPHIWMWFTMGLLKCSLMIFSYEVFCKYIKKFESFLICVFLSIGTSSLDFRKYFLIFDSQNFIAYTGQISRIFPLFVVSTALYYLNENDLWKSKIKNDKTFYLSILLFSFGICSTSLINSVWIMLIFASLLLFKFSFNSKINSFFSLTDGNFLKKYAITGIIVITSILVFYKMPYNLTLINFIFYGYIFYLIFLTINFFQINNYKKVWNESSEIVKISFLTIIYALIFGSFISEAFYSKTHLNELLQIKSYFKNWEPIDKSKVSFQLKDIREIGMWAQYNVSASKFITYYGSIVLITAAPIFLFLKNKIKFVNLHNAQKFSFHLNYYLILVLPIIFVIIDFMYILAPRSWMKTRFLEFPVYFLIVSSAIFIFRAKDKFFSYFFIIFFVVYSLVPVISTKKITQIKHNYEILKKLF